MTSGKLKSVASLCSGGSCCNKQNNAKGSWSQKSSSRSFLSSFLRFDEYFGLGEAHGCRQMNVRQVTSKALIYVAKAI